MKRRALLSGILAGNPAVEAGSPAQEESPFANKALPVLRRTTAGLEPYTGSWGTAQAAHLLRRTTFGPASNDIATLGKLPVSDAVDILLAPPPAETSQPLTYDPRDFVPVGQTWVDATASSTATTFNPAGIRTNSLKAWWMGLMLNQALSIREKMVLFWHNHFVTETAVVADPRFSYRYLSLLRANALGNFKDLVRQVTFDGAMLRYLNGNTNTKSSPNENYGRELQELFTIGKGPEVVPGDYTTYTEDDVKAAARVLTGWKDFTNADGTVGETTWTFNAAKHDPTDKQFSARYGGTVITGGGTDADGARELGAMLDMIFAQDATAQFICRKLYRWFVYYVIDDVTEANVIEPLAGALKSADYDILPVLRLLLNSAHFFDPVNMGCVIKSPIDHLIGVCRQFGVAFPADPASQYPLWNILWTQAQGMDMNPGDPPNVAGWQAYYQSPEFYELWINSDTLPKRSRFTDTATRNGFKSGSAVMAIDPIAFVMTLSNPADPNAIVDDACALFFPFTLTDAQRAFLKNTLLPGLPDYEWTNEWSAYLADPTSPTTMSAVKTKLQALFSFMMEMPEYQLM